MSERLDSDEGWVTELRDGHRHLARAQYAEVELLSGWFRRGAAADYRRSGRLLHSVTEGTAAAMEAAAVLRMSEPAVHRGIDVGLALDGLPCTRAAFAAGELDLDRVRVIVDVTGPVTAAVRAELDRRLAERGSLCAPGPLRATGRRWAVALDPDSARERRKRAVEDRDVRVRAAADGMAWLEGWLPIETAQQVAARLASMAYTQVCGRDPRTFPQRRADALLALVDGTGHLRCQCGQGTDCPTTGTHAGATGNPGVDASIQVGVSLETLLGLRDWPGYLHGAGAIDPDTARLLARDGRWEWIIAAIDAAATTEPHDNTDTGTTDADTTRPDTSAQCRDTDTDTDTAATASGAAVVSSDSAESDGPAEPNDAAVSDDRAQAGDAAEPVTAAGTDTTRTAGDGAAGVFVRNPGTESGPGSGVAAESENTAAPENTAAREGSAAPSDVLEAAGSTRSERSGTAARRAVEAACRAGAAGGWDDPDSPAALRYPWPTALAAWIRARDGSCRWPGCTVPARRCDIDHTIKFDHAEPRRGGRTIRDNGACLCRRHHRVKTDGENGLNGWRVRHLEAGRLEWTTPTGEIIITDPVGAPDLWPVPDLHLPTPPPPPERDGYISDPSIFDRIPYHSTIEDWLDYLLDSYPPPVLAGSTTKPLVVDLDEPPPF